MRYQKTTRSLSRDFKNTTRWFPTSFSIRYWLARTRKQVKTSCRRETGKTIASERNTKWCISYQIEREEWIREQKRLINQISVLNYKDRLYKQKYEEKRMSEAGRLLMPSIDSKTTTLILANRLKHTTVHTFFFSHRTVPLELISL